MATPDIKIESLSRKVGRNYLVNAKDFYHDGSDGQSERSVQFDRSTGICTITALSDNYYNAYGWFQNYIEDESVRHAQGMHLVLSVEVRTNSNGFRLRFDTRGPGHVNSVRSEDIDIYSNNEEWQRITVPAYIPADGLERGRWLSSVVNNGGVKNGDWIQMRLFMLEKGTQATPCYYQGKLARISNEDVGENLVIDPDEPIHKEGYQIVTYRIKEDWDTNETYTITVKGSVNEGQGMGLWIHSGAGPINSRMPYIENEGVYQYTFSPKSGQVVDNVLRLYNFPSSGATEARIDWVKLEKGDRPTPYKPLNLCQVDFSVPNTDIDMFEVRAVRKGEESGRGRGVLVERDDATYLTEDLTLPFTLRDYQLPAGETQSAIIEDEELLGEGNYLVSIYTKSTDGEWNE